MRRSASGAAGGPAEREQALRGALLRGVSEPLASQVIGELDGELVHEDLSVSWPWWFAVCSTVASRLGGHHT
jgi:hypothetical protein